MVVKRLKALLIGCVSILGAGLQAQPSVVPPVSPASGTHSASTAADVSATFTDPMNDGDASTFVVRGNMRGTRTGTYTGGTTTTLTMNPGVDFYPGELVEVTLTNGLDDTGAQPLNPAFTWRFRAAAGGGFGLFVDNVNALGDTLKLGTSIAAGDINGDGDLDLVVAYREQLNQIYVNDGAGNFSPGVSFGVQSDLSTVVKFGDMDGDGDLDIIEAGSGDQNRIHFNNGSGFFSSSVNFGTGSDWTEDLAISDLNGDGYLDIAVANFQEQSVIYFNDGAADFSSFINFGPTTSGAASLDVGDVDGDGDLDLIAGHELAASPGGQNYVYLNDGSGGFYTSIPVGPDDEATTSVAFGDLDNDGDLDIAWGNKGNTLNEIYLNDGSANFTSGGTFGAADVVTDMTLADVDGDGDLDIVTVSVSQDNLVYINDGSAGFGTSRNIGPAGVARTSRGVAVGDFDGDASMDIAVANYSSSQQTEVFLNEAPLNELEFQAADFQKAEGGGTALITVVRTGSPTGAVSVTYTTADNTATDPADYTATTGVLNWADGDATPQTFQVTINDDLDVEGDEIVDLTLSGPTGGATLGAQTTATLTILDDDVMPTVEFSLSNFDVDEDGTTATVTVKLSNPTSVPVTVDYVSSNGTATDGVDYIGVNDTLSIDVGEVEDTFDILILDDQDDELDETIVVGLSGPSNATLGAQTSATVTILDDDEAPQVAFSTANINYNEATGNVEVTVELNAAVSSGASVEYTTSDGTATAPDDYTAIPTTILNFGPTDTSLTFDVAVIGDLSDEDDETIDITLTNPTNATLGAQDTMTITIIDDDASPEVRFNATNTDFTEGAGNVSVTVSLSVASGKTVTVNYAASDNTAVVGSDYTATSGTLTFNPNQTSKNFQVPILDDSIAEDSELIDLTLSSPSNATLGSPIAATVTVLDTDTDPNVEFASATFGGGENTLVGTVTLSLDNESGKTVTVDYAMTDGTATSPADYTNAIGTVTFNPGETSATFDVVFVDDGLTEGNETIDLSLNTPVNATIGAQNTAVLEILDDETVPDIEFDSITYTVDEANGTVTLDVVLSNPTPLPVSVKYSTSDGTAVAPDDYTAAATATLNFAAFDIDETIVLTIAGDTLFEVDETFDVTLFNATNATLGTDIVTTVTITDDDIEPVVEFDAVNYDVGEADGTATVTVTLDVLSGVDVTVQLDTADNTAVAPGDYTTTSVLVTVLAGNMTGSQTIPIVDDGDAESAELIDISLSLPNDATLGTQVASTVTIIDDDTTPTADFSLANFDVVEGVSTATITVTLDVAPAAQVSVNYATSDNTALDTVDYTATSGTLFIDQGQTSGTFDVEILDDSTGEASEFLDLTLSAPSGVVLGAQSTATLTITDDEIPTVQFQSATVDVLENAGVATITVELSNDSEAAISVTATTANGSAIQPGDYTSTVTVVNFAPLTTTQTFDVPIIDDGDLESTETVFVHLSAPVDATLGAQSTTTLRILDDDTVPEVEFSIDNIDQDEDDIDVTVTVILSQSSGLNVDVVYATADNTAVDPDDYLATTNTLTFLPGETSQTFDVTIVQDDLDEDDELIDLILSAPVNATLGTQSTATITILDEDLEPEVALMDANTDFTEATANAPITVELSAISGRDVMVNYSTANNTATAGLDYTAASGTVTILAGNQTATFDVPVLSDSTSEGDELVDLTLDAPVNATLGAQSTGTLTVVDNDVTPDVNLPDATMAVLETDLTLSITVELSNPSALTVSVPFIITDGSATEGLDFTDPGGTLDFLPDEVSKTFDIPLLDDGDTEGDETLTIAIDTPTNATIGTLNTMQATIVDDESFPEIAFDVANTDIDENDGVGIVTVTVTLSASSLLDVTVDYATADNTATDPDDYTAVADTLTIVAGDTTATFDVEIIDDVEPSEGSELIDLSLTLPTNSVLGAQSTATITIIDDDVVPDVNFGFANINVPETAGTIQLSASLSVASGQTVTVNYDTSDNTATAGADYTAASGTIQFDPQDTDAFFSIDILDDGINEGDEIVTVTLSVPVNANLGVQVVATITIIDDDPAPPPAPPQFVSLAVSDPDAFYANGEQITIVADMGVTGLSLTADLSVVDSVMGTTEAFIDNSDNTYTLTSTLLAAGTLIEGVDIPITVTATDAVPQSTEAVVLVTIDDAAPVGQLSYNLPPNDVPQGTLTITLTYDEPLGTLPDITITGLGGGLDVAGDPMTGAVPGVGFTYDYVIPALTAGTATITIANASDKTGNAGVTPPNNVLTVTGGASGLTANAGADQTLTLLQTITLDGSASVGVTGYTWTQISGPSVTINNSTNDIANFNATSVGQYAFELSVTNGVDVATDVVNVTIPNLNPIVNAGTDLSFEETDVVAGTPNKAPLGFSATAYDPNGDVIYKSWELISQPTGGNLGIETSSSLVSDIIVYGSAMVPGVYEFELSVSDPTNQAAGTPVVDQLRVEVVSSSFVSPAAHAGMDQVVETGVLVTLSGNESADPDAVDPESPVLTYAWVFEFKPATSTATLAGATTKTPTFTPDVEGVYLLSLIVTDPDLLVSDKDFVTITANDESGGNYLSSAVIDLTFDDANSNSTINTGEEVTLDAANSVDGDGDPLTFFWEQTNGPATIVMSDPTTTQQVFTPTVTGTYTFKVTPNDGQEDGISKKVTFIVASASLLAPQAIVGLLANDDSDSDGYILFIPGVGVDNDLGNPTIELNGAASTKDPSASLTYRWTQTLGPTVGIVNASTSLASITPAISRTYEFELEVTDSNGLISTALLMFSVDTYDPIANPTGNSVPHTDPIADQNATTGQLITLVATSTDPDGDPPFAYYWVQTGGPPVVLDTSVFGQASFIAPIDATYSFEVFVDDGADIGLPQQVAVYVGQAGSGNNPPVAVISMNFSDTNADTELNTGETITLNGTNSSDADDDTLTYTWSFVSGPEAIVFGNPFASSQVFAVDTTGLYVVRLIVHDGTDPSAPADITISVSAASGENIAPTAVISTSYTDSNGNTQLDIEEVIELDGSLSTDLDGDPLTMIWEQVSGPETVTFANPSSESQTFSVEIPGVYRFRLRVHDGSVEGTPADTTLVVNEVTEDTSTPPPSTGGSSSSSAGGGGGCSLERGSQQTLWWLALALLLVFFRQPRRRTE